MRSFKLYLLPMLFMFSTLNSGVFAATPLAPKTKEEISRIDRTNSITVYPLSWFFSRLGFTYSFQLNDRIALTPGLNVSYVGTGFYYLRDSEDRQSESVFEIGTSLGARFFLSNTAFNSGWYVEPTLGLNFFRLGSKVDVWSPNFQAIGGYAWYWSSGLTLNLGAGIGYAYSSERLPGFTGWYTLPHPVLDAGIGYSW